MANKPSGPPSRPEKQRVYVSQADVPGCSLEKALKIPTAIGDNYGYKPSTPLQVAKAMEIQPTSGYFKMLTGAAIAYGLTAGGYNAESISITPLGMRIVRPTAEGDDLAAKREALLKPRIVREFLSKYNGAPIPKDSIAQNVLMEMGVPGDRASEVLRLILEGADAVGMLQNIKDRKYVDFSGASIPSPGPEGEFGEQPDPATQAKLDASNSPQPSPTVAGKTVVPLGVPAPFDSRSRRVFITHGKNKALIEPVKKLLAFGELEAVVSIQTHTVSQPVPGKVMEEMRSCGAAIIHVEDERRPANAEGPEPVVLNDNVLIEIGAAMALFGQRFILIVKEGVKLPSNLQGLLELRYKGETLDVEETVKLLEAINDMKRRPLPKS